MTVLWLSLAVLSRETTLLFAIAVLIAAFIQKWKNWRFFLIPPLVYTVWQIFLYIKWGLNNGISLSNISFPFVGFSKFFITSINESHVIEILCTSFIILYLFFIVVRVKRKTPPLFLIIACILYCSLFFSLSSYVWTEFRAYLRAFYELYILGIVVLLNSQPNQLLFAWFSGYKRTSNNKQVLSDE